MAIWVFFGPHNTGNPSAGAVVSPTWCHKWTHWLRQISATVRVVFQSAVTCAELSAKDLDLFLSAQLMTDITPLTAWGAFSPICFYFRLCLVF